MHAGCKAVGSDRTMLPCSWECIVCVVGFGNAGRIGSKRTGLQVREYDEPPFSSFRNGSVIIRVWSSLLRSCLRHENGVDAKLLFFDFIFRAKESTEITHK
jgi:hypothetical protein